MATHQSNSKGMVVTRLATRPSTPSLPLPSSLPYFFFFFFFAPLQCSGQLFSNVTIIQLLVNRFRLRIFLAIHVAFHLGQEVSYSFSIHKVPHLQRRKRQQHNSFFKSFTVFSLELFCRLNIEFQSLSQGSSLVSSQIRPGR